MARWLIEKAGVHVTVVAKSDKANAIVELALASVGARKVSTTRGIKLSVGHQDDAWRLCDHSNNLRRSPKTDGDLIYHLTDRIIFHIADGAQEVHCLHAAAVAHNGNALIIPGSSGDGKSSFVSWMVANDFTYLTDELILINQDRQVHGVGRPIQIKINGLDAVQSLIKDSSLIKQGKLVNALPIEALGSTKRSEEHFSNLSMFLFPRYSKEADYSFARLSSAQAGMRLMANHVNARNLDGHGFKEMMATIRQTPCYALEYGGFDRLPDNFTNMIVDALNDSDQLE